MRSPTAAEGPASDPLFSEPLARDGFASLGRVLSAPALARIGDAVDASLLAGAAATGHGVIVHNAYRRVAALADVIEAGELAAAVAERLGAREVLLFQDHLIAKPAGTRQEIAWHQDYGYWPLDAPRGLTLWIALDDADVDNGCLHYVPGSHRLGERRPADFAPGARQPLRAALPTIAVDDATAIAAAPVAAGAALVHDPLVWHMSPPNRSARPRRAWSLTWIAGDVRWAPAHAPHPYTTVGDARAGAPVDGPRFPRFACAEPG